MLAVHVDTRRQVFTASLALAAFLILASVAARLLG